MIPTEMIIPTARRHLQDGSTNSKTLSQDLEVVDELRDAAKFRMASYQQRIQRLIIRISSSEDSK